MLGDSEVWRVFDFVAEQRSLPCATKADWTTCEQAPSKSARTAHDRARSDALSAHVRAREEIKKKSLEVSE
jgi:hypothetical protein